MTLEEFNVVIKDRLIKFDNFIEVVGIPIDELAHKFSTRLNETEGVINDSLGIYNTMVSLISRENNETDNNLDITYSLDEVKEGMDTAEKADKDRTKYENETINLKSLIIYSRRILDNKNVSDETKDYCQNRVLQKMIKENNIVTKDSNNNMEKEFLVDKITMRYISKGIPIPDDVLENLNKVMPDYKNYLVGRELERLLYDDNDKSLIINGIKEINSIIDKDIKLKTGNSSYVVPLSIANKKKLDYLNLLSVDKDDPDYDIKIKKVLANIMNIRSERDASNIDVSMELEIFERAGLNVFSKEHNSIVCIDNEKIEKLIKSSDLKKTNEELLKEESEKYLQEKILYEKRETFENKMVKMIEENVNSKSLDKMINNNPEYSLAVARYIEGTSIINDNSENSLIFINKLVDTLYEKKDEEMIPVAKKRQERDLSFLMSKTICGEISRTKEGTELLNRLYNLDKDMFEECVKTKNLDTRTLEDVLSSKDKPTLDEYKIESQKPVFENTKTTRKAIKMVDFIDDFVKNNNVQSLNTLSIDSIGSIDSLEEALKLSDVDVKDFAKKIVDYFGDKQDTPLGKNWISNIQEVLKDKDKIEEKINAKEELEKLSKEKPECAIMAARDMIISRSISPKIKEEYEDALLDLFKEDEKYQDPSLKGLKNNTMKLIVNEKVKGNIVIKESTAEKMAEIDTDYSKQIMSNDLIQFYNTSTRTDSFKSNVQKNILVMSNATKKSQEKKILDPEKTDVTSLAKGDELLQSAQKSNDAYERKTSKVSQVRENDDDRSM